MNDIVQSLKKALINQRWSINGDKYGVGHPFEWVDGNSRSFIYEVEGTMTFLQYLSMNYENTFLTPEKIKTTDYDEMHAYINQTLEDYYSYMIPFIAAEDNKDQRFIESTVTARIQDYCFIKRFIKEHNINHLDIGAGLGTHSIYSLKGLKSCYHALEASPHSYSVQRSFFRYLAAKGNFRYLDLIDCENFNLNEEKIKQELNSKDKYSIKHTPSWYFSYLDDNSMDLISATWVLNEITFSGILWLISNVTRVLKKGGYFYIRDSAKLKAQRHSVNYDELILKLGFEEIERLDVKNRVNFFGIPRMYRKVKDTSISYDKLVGSLQWNGIFIP